MAKIIINSIDSFEEKISQKMIAKKIIENDTITFTYDNRYGKGSIKISSSSVEIKKNGEIKSHLILIPNTKTTFLYDTPFLKKEFTAECTFFEFKDNILKVCYNLYENEIKLNSLNIEIIEVL